MKPAISFLVLVFCFWCISGLSAQEIYWAHGYGGPGDDSANAICSDNAGNIYLSGFFLQSVTFGANTVTSLGNSDIYVAKLDPEGNCLWASSAGGAGYEGALGICADAWGNVFVTGYSNGALTIGTTSLPNLGGMDMFIAKLGPNGNWLWAVSANGPDFEYGENIGTDAAGNCYVTGAFRDQTSFGGFVTLTAIDYYDLFVAKLDTNGNWLWVTRSSGVDDEYPNDIEVAPDGTCVISGEFYDSAILGTFTVTSAGGYDVLVAKISSDGIWQWVKRAGGSGGDSGLGIALDSVGSVYITGDFYGTAPFGNYTLNSAGSEDFYVAKLSSSGAWQWAVSAGGVSYDRGYDIAADAWGNCYVTGCFYGNILLGSYPISSAGTDVFFAMINPDGNWRWANSITGSANGRANAITVLPDGTGCLTGYYINGLALGDFTITTHGGQDLFAVKFGSPIPSTPQNIQINRLGNDIHLTWNRVVTDIHQNPLTPDYYFVYYNYAQNPDSAYYFLDYTPSSIRHYVHQYAGLYSTDYFYQVTAVKSYGDDISPLERDNYLRTNLKKGMTRHEVEAVLRKMEATDQK